MYLLDANVFITSKNAHYGFNFVPAFWDWLDREYNNGKWCSIDKIHQELHAKQDSLTTWAGTRRHMFVALGPTSQTSLASLATWVANEGRYTSAAKSHFLASADYQLIAFAKANNHTVITHEVADPNGKNRVKIPDACVANGVPYMNTFSMLINEGARFVL